MRDTSNWYQSELKVLKSEPQLIKFVEQKNGTKREVTRLASLILRVELGLTLLHPIAPEEPATTVRDLLSGYRYPASGSDENWMMVRIARFYLLRLKGKRWVDFLSEYLTLPDNLKAYQLRDPDSPVSLSGAYHNRIRLYQDTIRRVPRHQTRTPKIVDSGRWLAKAIFKDREAVEIPVWISQEVLDAIPNAAQSQVTFYKTRQDDNPPVPVSLADLASSAKEMDKKLNKGIKNNGGEKSNYHKRFQEMEVWLHNSHSDDFEKEDYLTIDKMLHIVGLLNVGKSTLLEILTYDFAKQKKRCALIVNDVASSVRLASLFKHKLGIPAAPILGSNRAEQSKKIYEALLKNEGEDMMQGVAHPVQEWFSTQCPLLSFVESDEIWEFGKEPCHTLYQKQSESSESSNIVSMDEDIIDDLYTIGQKSKPTIRNRTCPFYYGCPRHQLERDIAAAYVWVLTPASFVHTPVPMMAFAENIRFAEAVYRECDFLFVDEADRVQVQFDEHYAPAEDLVKVDAFLNKLGLGIAKINNSNRSHTYSRLWVNWEQANNNVSSAVIRIYNLLSEQIWLVKWLGKIPFYSQGVFDRIIRELLVPKNATESIDDSVLPISDLSLAQINLSQEVLRLRRQIDGFLKDPLNRRKGGDLTDVANDLINNPDQNQALIYLGQWCEGWLEHNGLVLTDPVEVVQLVHKLRFAILVTVLDHHLIYLVDNLPAFQDLNELQDVVYSLVHRPPLDYLPVIPESPVGNLLGFLYQPSQDYRGGNLSYFRYIGVGRYLLLKFDELFLVDGRVGPHTILISGTSYAPDSPAYHISHAPKVLLKSAKSSGDISKSRFFAKPKLNEQGKHVSISGKQAEDREEAFAQMIAAISKGQPCFIDGVFNELADRGNSKDNVTRKLWHDRKRILAITGSYDNAQFACQRLRERYRALEIDAIQTLKRDNSPEQQDGVARSKVQDLRHTSTQLIFAPLMALERGHNILNEKKIAAFGAIFFLNRPMPVPDDWQTTVRQLNAWGLAKMSSGYAHNTISQQADEFAKGAFTLMNSLTSRSPLFKHLKPEERAILCATLAVSIWQTIGRGVRGGVPILVYFLDKMFAPLSAKGKQDDETTSLLVGIIKVLDSWMNDPRPYQRTVARELYGIFLEILKNTEDLNHVYR